MVNFKCNYVKHEYALTLGLNFCHECSNIVPYKSDQLKKTVRDTDPNLKLALF